MHTYILHPYCAYIHITHMNNVCINFSDDNGENSASFHPDLEARLPELGETLHGMILIQYVSIQYTPR